MYARAKVRLELAACYIESRVDYTVELLADMHQAELFLVHVVISQYSAYWIRFRYSMCVFLFCRYKQLQWWAAVCQEYLWLSHLFGWPSRGNMCVWILQVPKQFNSGTL